MCELFDCNKDVFVSSPEMWALAKADFVHSGAYESLQNSRGYMGHIYNFRSAIKEREKYRKKHHGKSLVPSKKHHRFFRRFYDNVKAVYGADVFVFTSVRDAVDHFVSSVRFFHTSHSAFASNSTNNQIDVGPLLQAAIKDPALHNPLADDFGLSTKNDVEWFVREYVRSCKVFFITLANLREGLDFAVRNITSGRHSLAMTPLPHTMQHSSAPFKLTAKLLSKIQGATQLDIELLTAVANATERCRDTFVPSPYRW
jgi:hypothetical protein